MKSILLNYNLMMKRASFFFILICSAFQISAQADTLLIDSVKFELVKELEIKSDYFTADHLGNIYVVKADELYKYNAAGELLFKQSYKSMGDITIVDATQSLRTLLFYRDLTQIAFVDNTLSVQGESIKLEKAALEFTTLTCASFVNNNFWIYRTDEFMISRLDRQLKQISSSGNLVQLLGKEINPDFITEADEKVFLNDSAIGIMVFDLFGTYIQTLPITGIHFFQVQDNTIMYKQGDDILAYNMNDFSMAKMKVPLSDYTDFRKTNNNLILSDGNKISIYKLVKK